MNLSKAGIIVMTIRHPLAILNTRIRAILNFKLTRIGVLDSEKVFSASGYKTAILTLFSKTKISL